MSAHHPSNEMLQASMDSYSTGQESIYKSYRKQNHESRQIQDFYSRALIKRKCEI